MKYLMGIDNGGTFSKAALFDVLHYLQFMDMKMHGQLMELNWSRLQMG